MVKKLGVFLFLFGVLFPKLASQPALADFEKIDGPNNKFGIHLAVPAEEDLEDAAALVNSSGGDWGYVTLVMEETDRDLRKWQDVFDKSRQLHLIPIVRLAASHLDDSWRKPQIEDAKNWADFLNSLNWVVKNRYVVLFNEPNFAKEWGNEVNPENYGQVTLAFAKALKEKNQDFFILPAGFNATAPHRPPLYETEEIFLKKMVKTAGGINEYFAYFDGWASHSYQTTTYLDELRLLKKMGLARNLPVFITETGWPHAEGLAKDFRIIAVTPFILNYQGAPFAHFSFRKPGTPKAFYPQYFLIQGLSKTEGKPRQEEKISLTASLPEKVLQNSTYEILLKIRNEGQTILSQKEGYKLELMGENQNLESSFSGLGEILPFHEETLTLFLKTKEKTGKANLSLAITQEGKTVGNELPFILEIVPEINIQFAVSLLPKRKTAGEDFKIIIYNEKEQAVFEKTEVGVNANRGEIAKVKNLTIGEKYRLVTLKPYYLPRQEFLTVKEKENKVVFKRLLPLDFNLDGKFSLSDLPTLLKNPRLLRLLLPN